MPEIVVVGAFTARAGQEVEARRAFEALVAPTHAEPGCILRKGSLAEHAAGG